MIGEENKTFCYQLPTTNQNVNKTLSTFCNLNTKWKPRISFITVLLLILVPVLLAWTLFVISFNRVRKAALRTYKRARRDRSLMGTRKYPKFIKYRRKAASRFNYIILTFVKYLVDTLDVMFDLYMFYQLEFGNILNAKIYRNRHVNNAIYAFALLGIIRILKWRRFSKIVGNTSEKNHEGKIQIRKNFEILFGYFIEDGPEMILEYFFIEKYITRSDVWYLLMRDVLFALLYLYLLFKSIKLILFSNSNPFYGGYGGCFDFYRDYRNQAVGKRPRWEVMRMVSLIYLPIYIIGPLAGLSQLFRIIGATYHYTSGTLNPACFMVHQGKLIQTPFRYECMIFIDYLVLVCPSIVLGIIPFLFLLNPYLWLRIDKDEFKRARFYRFVFGIRKITDVRVKPKVSEKDTAAQHEENLMLVTSL